MYNRLCLFYLGKHWFGDADHPHAETLKYLEECGPEIRGTYSNDLISGGIIYIFDIEDNTTHFPGVPSIKFHLFSNNLWLLSGNVS